MSPADETPKKDEAVEPETTSGATAGTETDAVSGATAGDAGDETVAEDARVAAETDAASSSADADETPVAEVADEAPASTDADEASETEAPTRRRRGGRGRGAAKADTEKAEPAKPARPAPSRRRAQRDPNAPIPVVQAQAKYVRSSARKARLVCDNIRGKSVDEARAILALTPRAVARDWSKLLESAIANAEHNHELVGEDLYVKAVKADEGPTIKRFRPRAMGRATRIRKRTSHLTIMLTPKD